MRLFYILSVIRDPLHTAAASVADPPSEEEEANNIGYFFDGGMDD
jgi:hypothetical protein